MGCGQPYTKESCVFVEGTDGKSHGSGASGGRCINEVRPVRLNAFLAQCGAASRRGADQLIRSGSVTVNGRTAVLGQVVDPGHDRVAVDGRDLSRPKGNTTILLFKPAGYLVSRRDPHHSRTIYDLLPEEMGVLTPVGRLDLNTEGAILLTSDGALSERLTHPRYGVPKRYRALVRGTPNGAAVERLRAGVPIEGGLTAPAEVRIVLSGAERIWPPGGKVASTDAELDLVLREGKKREVRLMCEAVGHRVLKLRRTEFAGIGLTGLTQGRWRKLTDNEIARLGSPETAPVALGS